MEKIYSPLFIGISICIFAKVCKWFVLFPGSTVDFLGKMHNNIAAKMLIVYKALKAQGWIDNNLCKKTTAYAGIL